MKRGPGKNEKETEVLNFGFIICMTINLYFQHSVLTYDTESLDYGTVSWSLHLNENQLRPISLWLKYIYFPCSRLCCIKYETFLLLLFIWHKYRRNCFATGTSQKLSDMKYFDIYYFTSSLISVLNKTVYSISDKPCDVAHNGSR